MLLTRPTAVGTGHIVVGAALESKKAWRVAGTRRSSHLHGRSLRPSENFASILGMSEPSALDLRALRAAIAAGTCTDDAAFDAFIPPADRVVSEEYWTPLRVASRIAQWLEEFAVQRIVDVGAGVGKMCVAASLRCNSQFIGVEHRARLVEAAQALARAFEVEDRVQFVQVALGGGNWPSADAYYLYNPFGENLCVRASQLDEDVELSTNRFARDVAAAERFLANAPDGTYVITYNGFGGEVPATYREVASDLTLPYELRCHRKVTSP